MSLAAAMWPPGHVGREHARAGVRVPVRTPGGRGSGTGAERERGTGHRTSARPFRTSVITNPMTPIATRISPKSVQPRAVIALPIRMAATSPASSAHACARLEGCLESLIRRESRRLACESLRVNHPRSWPGRNDVSWQPRPVDPPTVPHAPPGQPTIGIRSRRPCSVPN